MGIYTIKDGLDTIELNISTGSVNGYIHVKNIDYLLLFITNNFAKSKSSSVDN